MSALIEREVAPNGSNGVHPELKKMPFPAFKPAPERPELEPERAPVEPAEKAPEPGEGEAGAAGRKRPAALKALLVTGGLAVLLTVGAWSARSWQYASTHVGTDDAYVTTDVVQVTPQVSGNIT